MPMVRVLLDACVPHWLRNDLAEFEVETSHYAGLDKVTNGVLLAQIEGRYDVLVTLDRNMTYQQKLVGRAISVVVLRPSDQAAASMRALLPELKTKIACAVPGMVAIVRPAP